MIAVSNVLPLPNPPLIKAIVYTQVKLPPLIPPYQAPYQGGKPESCPLPKASGRVRVG
jgi:hypothetical protein